MEKLVTYSIKQASEKLQVSSKSHSHLAAQFFVRSGLTGWSPQDSDWGAGDALSSAGYDFHYQSQTSIHANSSYRFVANSANAYASGYAYRYWGLPLRCLYAS